MKEVISINASQPQQTLAGALVEKMFYGTFLESVLKRGDEFSGFPHNGGMHTLYIKLSLEDLRAFLQTVEVHFKPRFPEEVEEFISNLLAKIAKGDYRRKFI